MCHKFNINLYFGHKVPLKMLQTGYFQVTFLLSFSGIKKRGCSSPFFFSYLLLISDLLLFTFFLIIILEKFLFLSLGAVCILR